MKKYAALFLGCFLLLAAGCSMGPSKAEVETAFRESLHKNDVMGLLSSTIRVEQFQVDKIEKRDAGVYEATVTYMTEAQLGPLAMGGATQRTLRLKKLNDRWVVLQ